MDDIYKNIEEHNPNKKCEILIVFDVMIADVLSNEKLNPIVTELFIRGRKQSISLVFTTKSFFAMSKNIRPEFYALLYYENSKQTRTSKNRI